MMKVKYFSPAALGIAFLMASSLLGSCLSASSLNEPWWYNPCNSHVERIRHGRSADQELVKDQLRIFIGKLNTSIMKDLNSLYKEVLKTKTPFKGKLHWLRIKKMLNKMKSPTIRLGVFHESLQFFAGTLQKLSHIKIRTNATRFRENFRQKIYHNTSNYLKLLLCEVEYTLERNGEKVPAGIPLKRMKIKLPTSLDLTGVHILDTNFFKKMKMFISRTQKLFKAKKQRLIRNSAKRLAHRTKLL